MLKKFGIGSKIAVIISLLIILALAVEGLICSQQAAASLESSMESNLKQNVQSNAETLSMQLEVYTNEVKLIASKSSIQSMDWAQQLPDLKQDMKTYGFTGIGVAKMNGMIKNDQGNSTSLADRAYFQAAVKGTTVFSDPLISKTTGKMTIYLATPIYNAGHAMIGVLVANLDSSFLSTLTKNVKGSSSGYGFVINSQGTIIGDKDLGLVTKQENYINDAKKNTSLAQLADIITIMKQGKTGVSQYSDGKTNNYVAYTEIPGTTWSIGAVALKNEVLAGVSALDRKVFIYAVIFTIISILICLLLSILLVSRPLSKTVKMIRELSKGHLGTRLEVRSRDEVGQMSEAMNSLADMLQNKVLGSIKKIAAGDMDVRIDSIDEGDEISPVVRKTMAAVSSIVGESNDVIEAVQAGDLGRRCDSSQYSGSWKTLAAGMNALCDTVSVPIQETREVINKIAVNDFTSGIGGQYHGVFKALADDVNAVRSRLINIQGVMTEISVGNTSRLGEIESIGKLSEEDRILPAEIGMMRAVEGIVSELNRLSQEAVAGNIISARGNADKFSGGYRQIVEGFNATLGAVSEPLSEALEVLGRMSLNDYTSKMSESYQGDYRRLAQAVNAMQEHLLNLQNVAVKISGGDISELERFKSIGKRSENDEILPAFTRMMESIRQLIDEMTRIAGAAAQGQLGLRGDKTEFSGGYASVIEKINSFLDAVERPTNEVTRVMETIADARFDTTIEGEFNGQFRTLVDAVNETSRSLKAIIDEVTGVLTRMAGGDFSLEKIQDYNGEFKSVSDALNSILDSLNGLFGSVNETASQVASGSAQVSQGSQQLSEGATEQASSVEELSSNVSGITDQTKNNAANANNANSLVSDVMERASAGSEQMRNMVTSVEKIRESSQNISKIIKVIDDIAFQTNILSLNAAVEAARAGQYGKGFAVVAEEVRNLASKSAEAARRTTDLIEDTVNNVESGTSVARDAASAFEGIAEGVTKVASIMAAITDATNDQAQSIVQIQKSLDQVSKVIQTNSATSEESAAASEELSGQAAVLKDQIAKFSLRGSN